MNAPHRIDANTQLYGIFGNPVAHSLSPKIHNAEFQKRGINAVYTAFEIQKDCLGLAFEAVRALNIRGVNITIPFKEEAVDYVDEIPEDLDRGINAINTVVNRDGKLYGHNTDAPGLLWALGHSLNFKTEGKKILVLGAGGAARGAVFALAYAHAEKIWIYNRTQERAHGLLDYASDYFPETEFDSVPSSEILKKEKIDIVVNATSCGMKEGDPAPIDLKSMSGSFAVYDLVYRSGKDTALVAQAKSLGHAAAGGLSMLASQAALAFGLWTGQKEGVLEHMMETLK